MKHVLDRTAACITLAIDLSAARDPNWRDELAIELLHSLRSLQLDLEHLQDPSEKVLVQSRAALEAR